MTEYSSYQQSLSGDFSARGSAQGVELPANWEEHKTSSIRFVDLEDSSDIKNEGLVNQIDKIAAASESSESEDEEKLPKPEEGISQLSDDRVSQVSGPCFGCCVAPPLKSQPSLGGAEALPDDYRDFEESEIQRTPSSVLNKHIIAQLSRELEESNAFKTQNSKTVVMTEGIVSFGTFSTSKPLPKPKFSDFPAPLHTFLPPSPFTTDDGKLGIDCKAFKLDFTDTEANIIPPFFLENSEKYNDQQVQTIKHGVSYAPSIFLF